jgi:thiol-disulfide isomerase/thioredoxin
VSRSATPKEASELLARAERLWRDLGGGEPGWKAWREAPAVAWVPEADPEAIEWETVEEPLPDFSLQDLEGRTWTLADLKGKTTLVNLWAVWCGPCRAELPYLQKLHDRLKGRQDLQVLTLNTDENPGSVAPFVKDGAYTFPVLLAEFYVSVTMDRSGIPRNWIVDRDGTLQIESIGFGGNGDRWVEDMLKLLETSAGS